MLAIFHPDKNPGNDVAEERFKEVSAAYDVLGDEDKRAEYDEVRRMGPAMMGGRHGGSDGFSFNVGDMGDVLGGMFGRGGRQRGGGGAGIQPRRGADVEASLTIDFADAVTGLETTLHLTLKHSARRAGAAGRKLVLLRRFVVTAAAEASPTTTRACSRSPHRARSAKAGAP